MQIIAFHKHEIATFKAVGAEIGQVQCHKVIAMVEHHDKIGHF